MKSIPTKIIFAALLTGCASTQPIEHDELASKIVVKMDPYAESRNVEALLVTNKKAFTIQLDSIFTCRPIKSSKTGDQLCQFTLVNDNI